ncbi:hypothetical protein [Streptomyces lavendulae]|uniref:hypothetical protein n=1 Tax=Streptomyces lavendulae TaxID=1914 RepID=UPI0025544A78|nr:hypothetical protein [Streptomyces lavendulae]
MQTMFSAPGLPESRTSVSPEMDGETFSGVSGEVDLALSTQGDFGVVERVDWSYAEAVGVGPFRFGMTISEVVEAAGVLGPAKVSDCRRQYAVFSQTWKVEVHRGGGTPSAPAVTAYVSQDAGLFGVACDAVQGPQVAYHGLLLVGREMGDLESDMIAYAEVHDMQFRYTCEGHAGPDDPGIVMRAQPVGEVLRSRPLFMVPRDGACTEWDSLPSEEAEVSGPPAAKAMPPDNPWPDAVRPGPEGTSPQQEWHGIGYRPCTSTAGEDRSAKNSPR